MRLDGVVYAQAGSATAPGAPAVGPVLGTGELSSCNGSDTEGIAAGPYFAEDAPAVEVLAVQGLDPAVVVAAPAPGTGAVTFLVDPDAPPAEVDAVMTAIGGGPG